MRVSSNLVTSLIEPSSSMHNNDNTLLEFEIAESWLKNPSTVFHNHQRLIYGISILPPISTLLSIYLMDFTSSSPFFCLWWWELYSCVCWDMREQTPQDGNKKKQDMLAFLDLSRDKGFWVQRVVGVQVVVITFSGWNDHWGGMACVAACFC